MSGPLINFPPSRAAHEKYDDFCRKQRAVRAEKRAEAHLAGAALERLIEAMRPQTGQGRKLRALLFSLWNGKPANLSAVSGLDWELRKDFAAVLLAFGFEEAEFEFFYLQIEEPVRAAGLWPWFLEEGGAS